MENTCCDPSKHISLWEYSEAMLNFSFIKLFHVLAMIVIYFFITVSCYMCLNEYCETRSSEL